MITARVKRRIGRFVTGALVLSGASLGIVGPANAVVTTSPVGATLVTQSDIRPNEATYPGWHEGRVNSTPAFLVEENGVHLGIANVWSQIIKGLVDSGAAGIPVSAADLGTLITGSKISIVSGQVSAQVAVTTNGTGGWGTLRPLVPASTSTPATTLTDQWVSSKNIGDDVIKDAPMELGSLLTALGAQGNLRYSAYGFFSMEPSVVSAMTWDGATYDFGLAAETKTTLSDEPSSSFGPDVTYTATVSNTTARGGTPTGDVQFYANASKVGDPVPLTAGKASYTFKGLPVGSTAITAKFPESHEFLASEAVASHSVTAAPTTITLASPVGTLVGANAVLTATVKSGAGVPTGTVEFSANDGAVTSVDLADGKAAFTVTKAHVGITSVLAEYKGSTNFGQSSTATDVVVDFPAATGTPTEVYITRVYRDLFGRNADDSGMKLWTAKLTSGTSRGAVANGITYSTEYRSGLISDAYAEYLGRTPDAGGLNHWLGAMSKGWTVSQMESGFMASPEYYAHSGDTDWAWVGQMYADVLNRPAATSEVKYWVHRLSNGSSRTQVSMGFLLSTEHLSTVVNGDYLALLHRNLDPSGRATWVRILQAGGRDEAIIAGIVSSKEYLSQH